MAITLLFFFSKGYDSQWLAAEWSSVETPGLLQPTSAMEVNVLSIVPQRHKVKVQTRRGWQPSMQLLDERQSMKSLERREDQCISQRDSSGLDTTNHFIEKPQNKRQEKGLKVLFQVDDNQRWSAAVISSSVKQLSRATWMQQKESATSKIVMIPTSEIFWLQKSHIVHCIALSTFRELNTWGKKILAFNINDMLISRWNHLWTLLSHCEPLSCRSSVALLVPEVENKQEQHSLLFSWLHCWLALATCAF